MVYITLLVIAATVSFSIAALTWRYRTANSAAPFALLALTVGLWSLGYALELAADDIPAKIFWARIEYIGIAAVPVAWLAFTSRYTGRDGWLSRRSLALLAVEPLIALALFWTNHLHGLFWRTIALSPAGSLTMIRVTYGPAFWVHIAYVYLSLLIGTVLLIQALIRSPGLYRGQAAAILLGALAPWVGNGLTLSGASPIPFLDWTPIGFAVSGVVTGWALFRYRLLDIVPVARDRVVENMSDGMIVLDAQDRIVDINPAACRIVGRAAGDTIGQSAGIIFERWPALVERYRHIFDTQSQVAVEIGAALRVIDLRISPLHDRAGGLNGRLIVLHDITELNQAKEAAGIANRVKQAFLANMSHELRTPLHTIVGYSELIMHEALQQSNTTIVADLQKVQQAARRLQALIGDVLDLSILEAGQVDVYPETFAISGFVENIVMTIQPSMERQQNSFALDMPDNIGTMHTDAAKLRQVLLCVLNNAAKFTQQGAVSLRVRCTHDAPPRRMAAELPSGGPDGEASSFVVFEVADTGIGMPPEQLQRLFQMFAQGDDSPTRRFDGAGIGLALGQRLCQLLGGDIAATSQPGEGTTITIRVPASLTEVSTRR